MNQQIKQKLPNKILIDEKLAIKVIKDCRTTPAHKFRTKLGFKKYDIISTMEQLVLTKIISSFEEENMPKQCKVLGCTTD